MTRIRARFEQCFRDGRTALVTFVMAGDPDPSTSSEILRSLPAAGADIIELGIPFSDPIGDGVSIQNAAARALKAGTTLRRTIQIVREFRETDSETPLVLMGYYNSICAYGAEFVHDAKEAGIDALMIIDLPPEEDQELCLPALAAGLEWIRFVTPTTDERRLPKVLENSCGFLYYVSVNGVSGSSAPDFEKVRQSVARVRESTSLPIAVGFGIKTPESVAVVGTFADAAVVGSAITECIESSLDGDGRGTEETIVLVTKLVASLAKGARKNADRNVTEVPMRRCPPLVPLNALAGTSSGNTEPEQQSMAAANGA